MTSGAQNVIVSWRRRLLLASFSGLAALLVARAVQLQVLDNAFLAGEGQKRHLRVEKVSAHRGPITDRHGEPLAVSTPVDAIWAHPRELSEAADGFAELARQLERDAPWLARRITSNLDREFVYLRRHMRPDRADRVMALGLPGVYRLREYRRYYPAS